jgi:hypothetical protein
MKRFIALVAVAVLSLLAGRVHAQTTGPSVLGQLSEQLNAQKVYLVQADADDQMSLVDATSGDEVFQVQQVSSQQLTITGMVARMQNISPEKARQIRSRIALFNFSSPVGTLTLDEGTGVVTMEHHMNPRVVTMPAMASTARLFGVVARNQSQTLLQ